MENRSLFILSIESAHGFTAISSQNDRVRDDSIQRARTVGLYYTGGILCVFAFIGPFQARLTASRIQVYFPLDRPRSGPRVAYFWQWRAQRFCMRREGVRTAPVYICTSGKKQMTLFLLINAVNLSNFLDFLCQIKYCMRNVQNYTNIHLHVWWRSVNPTILPYPPVSTAMIFGKRRQINTEKKYAIL